MGERMRGSPNDFPSLKPGGHVCLLHADDEEKYAAITGALLDGLLRGERCIYWGSAASFAAISRLLGNRRIAVTTAKPEALVFLDSAEYHASVLDADTQASSLKAALAAARAEGFTGLRVISDPSHKTRRMLGNAQTQSLEISLSRVCADLRVTAACAFDRSNSDASALEVGLTTHEEVFVDGRLCPNPFFEPPLDNDSGVAPAPNRADSMINHIAAMAKGQELLEAESAALIVEGSRLEMRHTHHHRQIEALNRAIEARDRLLITAARWLSRPLPAMCNHLEELARDDRLQPYHSALSTCDEHLAAVTRLSQGLDEVASFLQMQVVLRPESLDIVEVVRSAIAELSEAYTASPVVVTLEGQPGIQGTWDRLRLIRLFDSLIRTAREQGYDGQVRLRLDDLVQIVRARLEFMLPHAPSLSDSGERVRALAYGASGESDYERLAVRLWPAREMARMMGGTLGISTWADARVIFTLDLPKTASLQPEDEKNRSTSGSEARTW
jgi:signal transduction histidine kinase